MTQANVTVLCSDERRENITLVISAMNQKFGIQRCEFLPGADCSRLQITKTPIRGLVTWECECPKSIPVLRSTASSSITICMMYLCYIIWRERKKEMFDNKPQF